MKICCTTLVLTLSVLLSYAQVEENSRYYDIPVNSIVSSYEVARQSQASFSVDLPVLNYGVLSFQAKPNTVLSPEMRTLYPNLHTFDLKSEAPYHYFGKLTIGDGVLYAIIQTTEGMLSITPSEKELGRYQVFYDAVSPDAQEINNRTTAESCTHAAERDAGYKPDPQDSREKSGAGFTRGDRIRTYRVAVVATGEFTVENGGAANAATVITNTINGWNIIYEKDLGVTFVLLPPQIYPDAATDPLDPAGDGRTNQAAEVVNMNFALADYDIGHIFHDSSPGGFGGGGVAGLGVVCRETDWTLGDSDGTFGPAKAAGWSGSFNNTGNGWIQLSAHEVGHMFNAPHTFNGTNTAPGNCTNNISSTNSYEIGSGTTIMSYNGLCQADNNVPDSGVADNYFHTMSLERMNAYITTGSGSTCGVDGPITNNVPVVDADPCASTFTIPIGTPFSLTGNVSDADGDALTYCWEQIDEDDALYGAGSLMTQGFIGAVAGADPGAPLFRSYPPSPNPTRTFPNNGDIKDGLGTPSSFEVLPTVARTMNFGLTVRDCNGGVACESRAVTVDASGPLVVNDPCSGGPINASDNINVTWNTNGSDALCSNVDILMSIDGGCNFPYMLASGVTYSSGTGAVTIPAGVVATTEARFQVVCSDNPCVSFFAMTETNCTINSSCMAGANVICPTVACTFPVGDAGLNLTLDNYFGGASNSVILDIDGTDPSGPRGLNTTSGSGVCTTVGSRNFETFEFLSTTGGAYGFSRVTPGFLVISLYEAAGFNSATPCASTFLGSNGYMNGASASASTGFSATLNACTSYILVAYASSSAFGTNTINIAGGEVIIQAPAPAAPFDGYTYIAVDDATANIAAQSATSDFTALGAGCYEIYGVSYENTLDPTTWPGNSVSSLAATSCLLPSSNSKTLKVTSNCGVSPGDLIITEIMFDPSGAEPAGEWFEVFNTTGAPIDMNGLVLCDNAGSHTIGSSVVVAAGAYAVLGNDANMAVNGGVAIDYDYATLTLANGGDEVNIKCADGTLIDGVDYSGFGLGNDGSSIQLDPTLVGTGGDTANDNGSNWFTSTSSTTFGGGDNGTPGGMNMLPVELVNFNGEMRDGKNYLYWITSSELGNDHFVIERSENGTKFEPIGKISGAGTTVETQRYNFIDLAPRLSINYYRLKQVDTDGLFEYSKIISINNTRKDLVTKVYPSPTSTLLNVEANEEMNTIEIIDITGRMVMNNASITNKMQLDVSALTVGTYFVRIQTDNAIKVVRFIKN